MGCWRQAVVLLSVLVTGGCGAATVIQQHNVEDTKAATDITAAMAATQQQCAAGLQSPELDPIRDKVSFNPLETPVRLLVLKDKPTPQEAQALLAWSAVRDKCGVLMREMIANLPLPPSMDAGIAQQARAGLTNALNNAGRGTNYLTAALYEKRISYGEFNKQRADLVTKVAAEHAAWVASWTAQDVASTTQKAAVAQQQADAAVAVLQAAAKVACASTKNRTVQAMC
jgi:hypothetical protein